MAYYGAPMALRIKRLRNEANLSQALLAEMAGLSRSQLSEIETEAKPVNTRRLKAIAKALGVNLEHLFDPEDGKGAALAELASLMSDLAPDDQAAILRTARGMAAARKAASQSAQE